MTWLAPAGLLGLLMLVVPVVVHLFGRPRARLVRFPSLRFLTLTRDAPTRRAVPSDWLLLVLRSVIVLVAVAALARPTWPGIQAGSQAGTLARAIVVDTSRSMSRLTSNGESAAQVAEREARRLASQGTESLWLVADRPGDALAAAAAWLEGRAGRREVVVLSDFQPDALVETDVRRLPDGVGLTLVRAAPVNVDTMVRVSGRLGEVAVAATARRTAIGTAAEWRAIPPIGVTEAVTMHAAESERPEMAAASVAARSIAARPQAMDGRQVIIVTAAAAERPDLLRSAAPLDAPWQADLLVRLVRNPLVSSLVAADSSGSDLGEAPVRVIEDAVGRVSLAAGTVELGGRTAVVLFPAANVPPLGWAALIAAANAALADPAEATEQDPATVPDADLRRLERPVGAAGPSAATPSAARWLWALVLALLALEWWVRRGPASATGEAVGARGDARAA